MPVALERLVPFQDDYLAVADEFAKRHGASNPFSSEGAEEGRSVLTFIQGREALAERPEYSEKYEELGRVARGGQADVRLVKRRDETEPYRLYVAWRPLETTAIGRIFDYARALERLDHPSIVKLVEVVRKREGENETIVLILDAAPGESVFSYLQNRKKVSADLLEQVRDQMLDALKYAWRQGLVHRDLKPENVMIAQDAEGNVHVTLLDYALAKFTEAIVSRTSSVGKGSVCYMAPEQLHYDKITEATDIHGMGLVLLDLLRGAPRRDTVEEMPPAEELEAMARRYAGDEAMQALIWQVEWMVHPDPAVRMGVLEDKVEETPMESASVSLIPISELATGSAMAMVGLRPGGLWYRYLRPIDIKKLRREFSFSAALSLVGGLGVGGALLNWVFNWPNWFVDLEFLNPALVLLTSLLTSGSVFVRSVLFEVGKEEFLGLEALLVMSQDDETAAAAAAKKAMTAAPNATRRVFTQWLDKGGYNAVGHYKAHPEPLFSRVVSALAEVGDDGESLVRQRMENILIYHPKKTAEQSALLIQALDRLDPASAPMRRLLFSEVERPSLYRQISDTKANKVFLRGVAGLEMYYHLQPTFTLEIRRRAIKALQVLFGSPPPGR